MQQYEVIAEFYQHHVARGELRPEEVPGPVGIAAEWVVTGRMARRARKLLLESGHAASVPTPSRPLGPITDRDMERFWSMVLPCNSDGCLLWDGTVYGKGYGQFKLNGRNVRSHRVAYEHRHGPLPVGLEVDHVFARGCRSRLCVNHEHLEAVTRAENNRRGIAAARWRASIQVRTELDAD